MSVTAPRGFVASGVAAGIKESGALDLALVASANGLPVAAAATFTSNLAAAAPVLLSRSHLAVTGGRAAAVVLNSGCANAATGAEGTATARATAALLGEALACRAEEVLVCSTGLIGRQLPLQRVEASVGALLKGLGGGAAEGTLAATAILTTDTHAKEVFVSSGGFSIGGMAKGAGMIAPNMATMLTVLTTDALIEPAQLASALRAAVGTTFNQLTVDGCTSTNDTVICLASGASGAGPLDAGALEGPLTEACAGLAEELASDAEGTTKVVRVVVGGAASLEDARRAARRVAESLLVKTSLYGEDPYWGRVLSELGASGAVFDPERASIAYGGILVCRSGTGNALTRSETDRLTAHMGGRRIELTCSLGAGEAEAAILTTDLGHGYVDENMRTS